MERFDKVWATLTPQRTDDLKPGSEQFVGWRGLWQAVWEIDEGPYTGQMAMVIYDAIQQLGFVTPFLWVPESDLIEVRPFL